LLQQKNDGHESQKRRWTDGIYQDMENLKITKVDARDQAKWSGRNPSG